MGLEIHQFFERHRPKRFRDIAGNGETKKKLYSVCEKGRCPKGVIFHGPAGCGKTTFARCYAYLASCDNISAEHPDPCGQCEHGSGERNYLGLSGGIALCNAAALTLKDLKAYWEIGRTEYDRSPAIVCDELHRAGKQIQNAMLSMIEDDAAFFVLIFCTLKPEKVEPALLQRLLSFEVRPPTTDEMVEHMQRVCSIEGWSRAESVSFRGACVEAPAAQSAGWSARPGRGATRLTTIRLRKVQARPALRGSSRASRRLGRRRLPRGGEGAQQGRETAGHRRVRPCE